MSATALTFSRSSARQRISLDPVVVVCVLALLLIGLVMVTSASMPLPVEPFTHLRKQLLFALAGIIGAIVAFSVRTDLWDRYSFLVLLAALALVIVVLIPGIGYEVNGARRWIRLGFFNFQASELARLFMIIHLCSYAVRHREALRTTLTGTLKPLGLLALMGGLLLAEPDFGAATVMFATGFVILFVAGMPWRHVIGSIVLASGLLVTAAVTSEYRVRRLTTFLDPWQDPWDKGFQLTQALIAIGRGEWFGVGLGASVQKLSYLPEPHTDFIFAVLAEEFGLVGVLVLLALLVVLIWRAGMIARMAARAERMFQAYLAAGFGIWLGLQAFINIGVNMGVLPTKGLSLPFLSYGGSNLLVTLFWLGILLRIQHECAAAGRLAVPKPVARRGE